MDKEFGNFYKYINELYEKSNCFNSEFDIDIIEYPTYYNKDNNVFKYHEVLLLKSFIDTYKNTILKSILKKIIDFNYDNYELEMLCEKCNSCYRIKLTNYDEILYELLNKNGDKSFAYNDYHKITCCTNCERKLQLLVIKNRTINEIYKGFSNATNMSQYPNVILPFFEKFYSVVTLPHIKPLILHELSSINEENYNDNSDEILIKNINQKFDSINSITNVNLSEFNYNIYDVENDIENCYFQLLPCIKYEDISNLLLNTQLKHFEPFLPCNKYLTFYFVFIDNIINKICDKYLLSRFFDDCFCLNKYFTFSSHGYYSFDALHLTFTNFIKNILFLIYSYIYLTKGLLKINYLNILEVINNVSFIENDLKNIKNVLHIDKGNIISKDIDISFYSDLLNNIFYVNNTDILFSDLLKYNLKKFVNYIYNVEKNSENCDYIDLSKNNHDYNKISQFKLELNNESYNRFSIKIKDIKDENDLSIKIVSFLNRLYYKFYSYERNNILYVFYNRKEQVAIYNDIDNSSIFSNDEKYYLFTHDKEVKDNSLVFNDISIDDIIDKTSLQSVNDITSKFDNKENSNNEFIKKHTFNPFSSMKTLFDFSKLR